MATHDHICRPVEITTPLLVVDGTEYRDIPALLCRTCGSYVVEPGVLRQRDVERMS